MLEDLTDEVGDFYLDLATLAGTTKRSKLLDQASREKLALNSHVVLSELIDQLERTVGDRVRHSVVDCYAVLVLP